MDNDENKMIVYFEKRQIDKIMNKQEADPFSELRQLRRTLSPVASDNKINIADFAPKEVVK